MNCGEAPTRLNSNETSREPDKRRPINRVDNESLRRAELLFFGLLILSLSAALAVRGVLFLRNGAAVFPVVGVEVPGAPGVLAGVFYLLLAASIAVAALAMVIRFRK